MVSCDMNTAAIVWRKLTQQQQFDVVVKGLLKTSHYNERAAGDFASVAVGTTFNSRPLFVKKAICSVIMDLFT